MGIFSSKSDLEKDADCIVTAVFLGVAIESGKGLKIAIEPDDKGKDPDVDLKDALLKTNAALKAINPKHTDVQGVVAPDWKPEGSWITGGLHTELDAKTLAPFVGVNKNADNNNYAPRIGFAYKLNQRMVVRSGSRILNTCS